MLYRACPRTCSVRAAGASGPRRRAGAPPGPPAARWPKACRPRPPPLMRRPAYGPPAPLHHRPLLLRHCLKRSRQYNVCAAQGRGTRKNNGKGFVRVAPRWRVLPTPRMPGAFHERDGAPSAACCFQRMTPSTSTLPFAELQHSHLIIISDVC